MTPQPHVAGRAARGWVPTLLLTGTCPLSSSPGASLPESLPSLPPQPATLLPPLGPALCHPGWFFPGSTEAAISPGTLSLPLLSWNQVTEVGGCPGWGGLVTRRCWPDRREVGPAWPQASPVPSGPAGKDRSRAGSGGGGFEDSNADASSGRGKPELGCADGLSGHGSKRHFVALFLPQ